MIRYLNNINNRRDNKIKLLNDSSIIGRDFRNKIFLVYKFFKLVPTICIEEYIKKTSFYYLDTFLDDPLYSYIARVEELRSSVHVSQIIETSYLNIFEENPEYYKSQILNKLQYYD